MSGALLNWWQMPGPADLVRAVGMQLRRGQCVIVRLPAHAPPGLAASVREWIDGNGSRARWQMLSPPPASQPAHWLWQVWCPDIPCPNVLTTAQLLDQAAPAGIYELCLPPANPANETATCAIAWLSFLNTYAQASQHIATLERGVFLVILDTPSVQRAVPKSEPLLTVLRYEKQATALDLLFFLTSQRRAVAAPNARSLAEQLCVQTAAALFPTDPLCAAWVVQQPDPLLSPEGILAQLHIWRAARAWPLAFAPDTELTWAHGLQAEVDGERHTHLVATPDLTALKIRIEQALWLAQVRVVLPWLEQERRRLITQPEIFSYLSAKLAATPYVSEFAPDAQITDPMYLELGPLCRLLPRWPAADHVIRDPEKLLDYAHLLRMCRNDLSHLQPIETTRLRQLLESEAL